MMAPMPLPRSALRLGAAAVVAALAAASPARPAADPAAALDLARFAGRWYVIARLPGAAPPEMEAYLEFQPHADGRVDERYVARPGGFAHEPVSIQRSGRVDPANPARWEIDRGWFRSTERWILYVSPDYRHALTGTPDRDAAWVLAREPVIAEWSYAGLLARLALQGHDLSGLRRVAQRPGQVGLPGFE